MKISDDLIRKVTISTIQMLGEDVSQDLVKKVVAQTIHKIENSDLMTKESEVVNNNNSSRVILTSYGLNKPGIIYRITDILAKTNCDIQDLSQKILQEYFTMIMIIDISNSNLSFNELREKLLSLSEEINVRIIIQHEEVFKYMHRI